MLKKIIKRVLRVAGIEVHKLGAPGPSPGSPARPIGRLAEFLDDIAARGFRPKGIIDVGANQGEWTRLALSIFPAARVILVEPQSEMMEKLRKLCEDHPSCSVVNAGAGRENGELVQTIWEDLAGSSFLPPVDSVVAGSRPQRRTTIVTLDHVLGTSFSEVSPDLVKLDIQGFELEALAGASTLFGRTELFIVETSLFSFLPAQPLAREVIAFMAERGYELYDITDSIRRPLDGALAQVDFAFALRNGFLRHSQGW